MREFPLSKIACEMFATVNLCLIRGKTTLKVNPPRPHTNYVMQHICRYKLTSHILLPQLKKHNPTEHNQIKREREREREIYYNKSLAIGHSYNQLNLIHFNWIITVIADTVMFLKACIVSLSLLAVTVTGNPDFKLNFTDLNAFAYLEKFGYVDKSKVRS